MNEDKEKQLLINLLQELNKSLVKVVKLQELIVSELMKKKGD